MGEGRALVLGRPTGVRAAGYSDRSSTLYRTDRMDHGRLDALERLEHLCQLGGVSVMALALDVGTT
jgi:hypothetical protein